MCEVLDSADEKMRAYHAPMKTKKVNIKIYVEAKEATIEDYQSNSKFSKIIELLHDVQELFPRGYNELKGVHESFSEMRINLKEGARPVRKRPYMMNLKLRIKVKEEIEKMFYGIIVPIKKSKQVSPMVINIKKDGKIQIFVDYRELNVACVIDPFHTPFTEEILQGITGCEIYSFTDGFSKHHQIRIAKKDQEKTTFTTEWGIFTYTVIPFGLKNAPVVFLHVVVQAFYDFIHKFLQVYLDDWPIYGLVKDHYDDLRDFSS